MRLAREGRGQPAGRRGCLHHTNNIPAMISTTSSRAEMVTQGKAQIRPVGNVDGELLFLIFLKVMLFPVLNYKYIFILFPVKAQAS